MKRMIYLIVFLFLISFVDAYEIEYIHQDHLGNNVAITNEEGDVIWKAEYEPFGSSFNEVGDNNYKYNSKEEDNTELLYYGARYYDNDIGRFTTPDSLSGSITDPQTLNRYVYVKNNPMKYIDPTGLSGEETFLDRVNKERGKHLSGVENIILGMDKTGDVLEEVGRFVNQPMDITMAIQKEEPWWSVALAALPFIGRIGKTGRALSLAERVVDTPQGLRIIKFNLRSPEEAGIEHMLMRHAIPKPGEHASLFVKKVDGKIVMQTEGEILGTVYSAFSNLKHSESRNFVGHEIWVSDRLKIVTKKETGEFITAFPSRRWSDDFTAAEWKKITTGKYDVVGDELILH